MERVRAIVEEAAAKPGPVVWLTGAGISAESGVPTFRGEEGYWKVGSRNYHPQELATFAAFQEMPAEVWAWYLFRRGVCRGAAPNAAHDALASLEESLGDRFLLVTQNVDGLHLRAGNTLGRTYQIHGNIDFMRPVRGGAPIPIPEGIDLDWPRGRQLRAEELALLAHEGEPTRPHVLWFDECYDEATFRFESSLRAAAETPLLVVVGTAGATNLPMQIGMLAARQGTPSIVIDPEKNPFAEIVERTGLGVYLAGTAGEWVPRVADLVAERF